MRQHRRVHLRNSVSILAAAIVVSGCSMIRVQPEAFGPSKTYAIVSISAAPKAYAGSPTGQTVSGLVKSASSESGYSNDATKLLTDSVPKVQKALQKNAHMRLLPPEKVLRSPAYAKAKGGEPTILWTRLLLADGYKYFPDETELGALAKALHVDGVIVVNLAYEVANSGLNLFGLLSLGTQRGVTTLTVTAVDREGAVVWRDSVRGRSDDSIGAIGESANFTKLNPLFLNATDNAVKSLIERFDQRT